MSPVEEPRGAPLVIYCDVIEGKGPSRCRREHVDSGFAGIALEGAESGIVVF